MQAGSKYTAEEKAQLLANLDIEVSHRVRKFQDLLADTLENFRLQKEGLILRIPRLVRDVTLREFVKYNGDVQACLQGLQRERLGGDVERIDKSTRKRKWVESQETEARAEPATDVSEPPKAAKSARMTFATPKKKPGPSIGFGTAHRMRLPTMKTPGTVRNLQRIPSHAASPSPHKPTVKAAFQPRPASPSKIPFASPSKPLRPPGTTTTSRVPSTNHFNPQIPASSSSTYPRWPRKDENMLSVNGSPLANPLRLGFDLSGWLDRVEGGKGDDGTAKGSGHSRMNSIIVRSASSSSTNAGDKPGASHQRTNSQSSTGQGSQPAHSRSNSRTDVNGRPVHTFLPHRNGFPSSNSQQTSTQPTQPNTPSQTPSLLPSPLPLSFAALVAVPTADGHWLEFDPFQTSPREIDALEDISDDAKTQAKEDMRRLVVQAMERWKIT